MDSIFLISLMLLYEEAAAGGVLLKNCFPVNSQN